MNIVNSSSRFAGSNIVYSIRQMLNTPLKKAVAGLAIAALVLMGAFLLQECYSRRFSAKTLPNPATSSDSEQLRNSALSQAFVALRTPATVVDFRMVESISQSCFTERNGFSFSIAAEPKCRKFNRYTNIGNANILPWNHNLTLTGQEEDSVDCKYVNASRIELGDQVFIATDAPTQQAMGRFWNMVWEQNAKVIVNLTEIFEEGRQKADSYWVESGDAEKVRVFGNPAEQNEILLTFEDENFVLQNEPAEKGLEDFDRERYDDRNIPYIVKRTYTLQKKGETKTVFHYHYRYWPDHGVPETEEGQACLMKLVHHVADFSQKDPILVHCSAGVGRTGTFLALYHFIHQQLAGSTFDHPELVVGELILEMRAQRSGMIQSSVQFNLVAELMRKMQRDPSV